MRTCCLVLLLTAWTLHAEIPTVGIQVWWRADQGVVASDSGYVTAWASVHDPSRVASASGPARPTYIRNAVNGHAAVRFNGSSAYLTGPDAFPVTSDYTLYAVVRMTAPTGANNIVSGNNRAMWLNSTDRPRVLHGGNFSQQAESSVGIGTASFSVIRIRYVEASRTVTIHVNNAEGTRPTVIPQNTDPAIFLASYARGNFLNGDIAEVVLYNIALSPSEIAQADTELHTRYGIKRIPDPPPPLVVFSAAPKPLELYAVGDSLRCSGAVLDSAVREVHITLDSADVTDIRTWSWNVPAKRAGFQFSMGTLLQPGLHAYRFRVRVARLSGIDTVLDVSDIVCGEVIAIEGQSNSIFPDGTLIPSTWARTFGSNFGQSASDTVYKRSIATGGGGGANVGGWGLYLQNRIATDMQLPTCVINGGVGGTRIESHFPSSADRTALGTIYGSWLYRLRQSRLADHVKYLFWYQGESNSSADRYVELFDAMYRAWHEDLPHLQRIIVGQIRPGCGGPNHGKLRDDQRILEERYADVYVHAAAGLPGHDGCHYLPIGYQTLGEQLYQIYKRDRLAVGPMFPGTAPRITAAEWVGSNRREIKLVFLRSNGLRISTDTIVGGVMRRAVDAFQFDADVDAHPSAVRVEDDAVFLTVPDGLSPTTVSYVPEQFYAGTGITYQGPWILTADGVGALTFFRYPIGTTGVDDETSGDVARHLVGVPGQTLAIAGSAAKVDMIDINGSIVTQIPIDGGNIRIPHVASGLYVIRNGRQHTVVIVP